VQTQQQLKALAQPGLDNSTGSWREQAQKAIDGLGKSLAKDGEERTIAIREVQEAVHENVKDIPFLGNAIDRRIAMIGTLAINTAGVESMAGMVMQDGGPKQLAIGLATMVGNAVAHPVGTAIAVNEAYSEASAKRGRAAVDMEIALNLVGLVYGGAKLVNGLRKGAAEAAEASKAIKGSEIAKTPAIDPSWSGSAIQDAIKRVGGNGVEIQASGEISFTKQGEAYKARVNQAGDGIVVDSVSGETNQLKANMLSRAFTQHVLQASPAAIKTAEATVLGRLLKSELNARVEGYERPMVRFAHEGRHYAAGHDELGLAVVAELSASGEMTIGARSTALAQQINRALVAESPDLATKIESAAARRVLE
jgi:hypothetical protein